MRNGSLVDGLFTKPTGTVLEIHVPDLRRGLRYPNAGQSATVLDT